MESAWNWDSNFSLKSVDWLGNVHMVAVGDIVLVRYALNDAETLLQAFGELVGCTFDGRTVNGERDIGFPFPFVAGIVHVLHDFQCEGSLPDRCGISRSCI